jgi:elongation factor G
VDGNGNEITVPCDPNGHTAVLIFKTVADQVLGKISFAKVISGKLKAGQEIFNASTEKMEKLGTIFFLRGKHRTDADFAEAGDIIAIGKMQHTSTGDFLCEKGNIIKFLPIAFSQTHLLHRRRNQIKGRRR